MAKQKRKQAQNFAPRIDNRRARHDYHIIRSLEVGIQLVGSEVKSIRNGHVSLNQSFARIDARTGHLLLHEVEIAHYTQAGVNQHETKRIRKLLAHKREIRDLELDLNAQSATLVPLAMYFKNGHVKIELALATGKRQHDKRESIKKRESDRDMRRAMTRKRL